MQAEQNELITRIGPGTACGALLRSYWQPVALLDEFDPRLDARRRRGRSRRCACSARTSFSFATAPAASACSIGRARTAAPTSRSAATRPTACAARSTAGSSASTAPASRRRPSRSARSSASACASAATRCWSAPACCSRGSAPEGSTPPALPAFDAFIAPASHSFAFKGPVALQLAAGVRGRHRPGASVVPAPLPAGRLDGRRRGLRPPVPRRQRRRRSAASAGR